MNDKQNIRHETLRKSIRKGQPEMANQYELWMEKLLSPYFDHSDRFCQASEDISLAAYVKSKPITRNSTRQYIYVQRLGKFSAAERSVIQQACEYLETCFGIEVQLLEDLNEDLIPKDVLLRQKNGLVLEAEWLIYNLVSDFVPRSAIAQIVITSYPLYSNTRDFNILGCALTKFRSAIWTLAPFNFHFQLGGKAIRRMELQDFFKLAAHEVGHIFSLPHCEIYECIMGMVDPYYLELYPMAFCPRCLAKLCWNLNFNELEWLERQIRFCQEYEFAKSQILYDRMASALR